MLPCSNDAMPVSETNGIRRTGRGHDRPFYQRNHWICRFAQMRVLGPGARILTRFGGFTLSASAGVSKTSGFRAGFRISANLRKKSVQTWVKRTTKKILWC